MNTTADTGWSLDFYYMAEWVMVRAENVGRLCALFGWRGFLDHDYAGIDRQFRENAGLLCPAPKGGPFDWLDAIRIGVASLCLTFNWTRSVPPESNPQNEDELFKDCDSDESYQRYRAAGFREQALRNLSLPTIAPEADNPVAGEAAALTRLAESAPQFKADDDDEVLSWSQGPLRDKAVELRKLYGSDEVQMERALVRETIPERPVLIEGKYLNAVTMPGDGGRWIDDRRRDPLDAPRNISIATLYAAVRRAVEFVTKPVMGKFLRDVSKDAQKWFWPGHIPLSEVTLIYGGEGMGKGFVLSSITATATRGDQFPDGSSCAPCEVLWLSGEDSEGTVGKRLEALGADDRGVVIVDGMQEEVEDRKTREMRGLSIKDDIGWFEGHIKGRPRTRLVIIEPLSAFAGKTKLIDEIAVRNDIIRPLIKLARRYNVAVVILAHPNKDSGKIAADRASGSRALTAAPRNVVMVGANPTEPEQRVFACRKPSLGKFFTSLVYRIDEVPGEEIPQFEWVGKSDLRYQELDLYPKGGARRPSHNREVREDAGDLLRRFLADGPRPEKEVEAEATERGISIPTLRRAAFGTQPKRPGAPNRPDAIVKSERMKGFQAGCAWSLI